MFINNIINTTYIRNNNLWESIDTVKQETRTMGDEPDYEVSIYYVDVPKIKLYDTYNYISINNNAYVAALLNNDCTTPCGAYGQFNPYQIKVVFKL